MTAQRTPAGAPTVASSFDFLQDLSPELFRLAAQAERYAVDDPHAALLKAGIAAEQLVKRYASDRAVAVEGTATYFDILQLLERRGFLKREAAKSLHDLRIARNTAAHSLDVIDVHALERTLRALHHSATYIAGQLGVRRASPFRWPPSAPPPPAAADATETLAEIARLERRLSEVQNEHREDRLAIEAHVALLQRELEERVRSAAATPTAQDDEIALRSKVMSERLATVIAGVDTAPVSDATEPTCPRCGKEMRRRTARTGRGAGQKFWGCSGYPSCRGTRPFVESTAVSSRPSGRSRSVMWRDDVEIPGYITEITSIGGRLRLGDPVDQLTLEYQHAATDAVVYRRGTPGSVSQAVADIAALVLRFACRGLRPAADRMVEAAIMEASAPDIGEDAKALEETLLYRRPFVLERSARIREQASLLHETYERPFFEQRVASLAPSAAHWCLPQAPYESLLRQPSAVGQRVDFAFAHPRLATTVVVEIDGSQHAETAELDRFRDRALQQCGIDVRRIPGFAIEEHWPAIADALSPLGQRYAQPEQRQLAAVWGAALANRTLYALACGVGDGHLAGARWDVQINEPSGLGLTFVHSAVEIIDAFGASRGVSVGPAEVVVRYADAVTTLVRKRPGTYERRESPKNASHEANLCITLETDTGYLHALPPTTSQPAVLIRSTYLPSRPSVRRPKTSGPRYLEHTDVPDRVALLRILDAAFGKTEFRPPGPHPRAQEQALRRLLAGRDVIALLPTGAGKSMIYQMASVLTPGVTVVVDPIVSLIEDQIDGLAGHGIDRVLGFSAADYLAGVAVAKRQQLARGEAHLVFIAPERLQMPVFRDALREMSYAWPVSTVVVDEAHCVSEWGHDFRTAYLDLGATLRDVCADPDGRAPALAALTGTASPTVLRDMVAELGIDRKEPGAMIVPDSFDRSELRFSVVRVDRGGEVDELVLRLAERAGKAGASSLAEWLQPSGPATNAGIVFCRTVGGQGASVETVVPQLQRRLGIAVGQYHGKMDSDDKRESAAQFKHNETSALVATSAYGMGIDKPNVRWIAHLGVPGSIEAYYQEAGRAGRDREPSDCLLITTSDDRSVHDFFHRNAYRGEQADYDELLAVAGTLGDISKARECVLPWEAGGSDKSSREKAILRLKMLGVVADYMVDFGRKAIIVRTRACTTSSLDSALVAFIARSQPDRAAAVAAELRTHPAEPVPLRLERNARSLLEFVYTQIAAARRRALDEMLLMTTDCTTHEEIRDRILRYLKVEGVAADLVELLERTTFDFAPWIRVLGPLTSPEQGEDLRGASARLLESSPDNPGLLLARSMAEAVIQSGDVGQFQNNLAAGSVSALASYGVTPVELGQMLVWLIGWTRVVQSDWVGVVYAQIDASFSDAVPAAVQQLQRAIVTAETAVPLKELDLVLTRRRRDQARWLRRAVQSFTTTGSGNHE